MRVACEVTQNLVEHSSARVKQLQRWGAGREWASVHESSS